MTFTKVEKVPKVRRPKHRLVAFFEQFMAENIKVAQVKFNEHDYKNATSAQNNLHRAARNHGFPIKVMKRGEEIYLVRTDM